MEVLVVLVDEVRRVGRVLLELLHHVSREELSVRCRDAPVELAHQLSGLGAVEEVYLRLPRDTCGWVGGWVEGWVNGCMDELMHGWMDGWMDGLMGGWMDGWVDGWMDGGENG